MEGIVLYPSLLSLDIEFLPFGPGVGDTSEMISTDPDSNVTLLGPLDLQVPVVYYLRREYHLYVSAQSQFCEACNVSLTNLF